VANVCRLGSRALNLQVVKVVAAHGKLVHAGEEDLDYYWADPALLAEKRTRLGYALNT
jgi:hypothetical protein